MELEKFRADLLHDDRTEDETLAILSTSLRVLNKFTIYQPRYYVWTLLVFSIIRYFRWLFINRTR